MERTIRAPVKHVCTINGLARNRPGAPGVRGRMSNRTLLPAALLLVAIGAAACSGAAGPISSPAATAAVTPDASSAASPSPSVQGLAHPTGADQIVLRYDSAGGFVPPEFLAARVPYFTLYGDGRIVFVQTSAAPSTGDISVGQPLRTARLSEEQIQSLLEFALDDGGLAIARETYNTPMIADAPTAVFTINADNDSKTVSAMGLGHDPAPGPDAAVLERLATLADRLYDFDQGGSLASDPYVATAYRGVLTDASGVAGVPVRAWPWPHLEPSDFTLPKDPNVLQQATHTLTPDDVAALKVDGSQNGIAAGIWVRTDDGKLYSLVIRPLLPDERA